jgi:RNase adaptor protein for sRNA GlmZ degradation
MFSESNDNQACANYRFAMSVLLDRVSINECWERTNKNGRPLLKSELRILKEKTDEAYFRFQASNAKLETRYVENRKKHPDDIDYDASEFLRYEKVQLGHIYEKYASKYDRECAKRELRLPEYEDKLEQEAEREWDEYNFNVSQYID